MGSEYAKCDVGVEQSAQAKAGPIDKTLKSENVLKVLENRSNGSSSTVKLSYRPDASRDGSIASSRSYSSRVSLPFKTNIRMQTKPEVLDPPTEKHRLNFDHNYLKAKATIFERDVFFH